MWANAKLDLALDSSYPETAAFELGVDLAGLEENSRSRLDGTRSWPRPQAATPLMRLRFGGPIGGGRPVGRPPDTSEKGRFGKILAGCHQASIAVAVRLSAAFDGTLGAHLLYESDQGRKQARRSRADPPKVHDLIVDHPRRRIEGLGNHPAYDFGRRIYRPFDRGLFAGLPGHRLEERLGRYTDRLGDRVRT